MYKLDKGAEAHDVRHCPLISLFPSLFSSLSFSLPLILIHSPLHHRSSALTTAQSSTGPPPPRRCWMWPSSTQSPRISCWSLLMRRTSMRGSVPCRWPRSGGPTTSPSVRSCSHCPCVWVRPGRRSDGGVSYCAAEGVMAKCHIASAFLLLISSQDLMTTSLLFYFCSLFHLCYFVPLRDAVWIDVLIRVETNGCSLFSFK